MTQSNTKQLPTRLDPHILVPSVIPFHIDMRGKSLSHFIALHPLLNNGVNHQMIPYLFLSNWGLQSNYQDNQTCV